MTVIITFLHLIIQHFHFCFFFSSADLHQYLSGLPSLFGCPFSSALTLTVSFFFTSSSPSPSCIPLSHRRWSSFSLAEWNERGKRKVERRCDTCTRKAKGQRLFHFIFVCLFVFVFLNFLSTVGGAASACEESEE